MNASNLVLTLLLSTCLMLRAAEPFASPAVMKSLPAEVAQFYMDANFVSCFSTGQERQLVDLALKSGRETLRVERLNHVMQSVRRLRASVYEPDPKFIHWAGGSHIEQRQLIQAVSMETTGGEIRVMAHVWTLTEKSNQQLVSQYELPADAVKTLEVLQQGPGCRTVTHVWRKHGPRWLRKSALIVPLKLAR